MKERLGLTIFGIVVAIVGIIVPIAWDHYKSRSALELQHLATITLVEKTEGLDKLKILYDGRPITSVSRLTFALVNSGRTPIRKEDLVLAPTLRFTNTVELLEFHTERLVPNNLQVDSDLNATNLTLSLSFPLLNPSDLVQFSVLVAGRPPSYEASARIVGVNSLTVIDRAKELEKERRRVSWNVYVSGILGVFFLLGAAAIVPLYLKEVRVRRQFSSPGFQLPPMSLQVEYTAYVEKTFDYISERRSVLDLISKLATHGPIKDPDRKTIESAIFELAGKSENLSVIMWAGVIGLAGISYLLWNLL